MQTERRNFFGKGKFQFSHKIFYWIQVMSLKLEFALLFMYVNCFKTKGLQENKTSRQYDLVGLDILVLFNFTLKTGMITYTQNLIKGKIHCLHISSGYYSFYVMIIIENNSVV